jgi:hypothetical protein
MFSFGRFWPFQKLQTTFKTIKNGGNMNSCGLILIFIAYLGLLKCQRISVPLSQHPEVELLETSNQLDTFAKNLLDEWVPMDIYESLNFFTGFEVCQRFITGSSSWCQERFQDDMGRCNVGSDREGYLHGFCSQLSSSFYRHQSTRPWPETRNIVDVMILMLKYGYDTLFLFGDSITRQHFSEMACQLKRLGIAAKSGDLLSIEVPDLDKFYAAHPISFDVETDTIPLVSSTFRIHYQGITHRAEFERKEFNEFKRYVEHLRSNSTVILFNAGLHFNDPQYLQKVVSDVFQYTMNYLVPEKGFHVFFRESSAQHFPTANGVFHSRPHAKKESRKFFSRNDPIRTMWKSAGSSLSAVNESHIFKYFSPICEPIKNEKAYHEQNWRNRLVIQEIEKFDPTFSSISVLPFYHSTAARYDLHLDNFDCAHYCNGPMLWAPLTHELVMMLHKKFVPIKSPLLP